MKELIEGIWNMSRDEFTGALLLGAVIGFAVMGPVIGFATWLFIRDIRRIGKR